MKNTAFTLSDGYPFTVYSSALRFTDRTCDGNLPPSQRTENAWYDVSCFPTKNPVTVTTATGAKVSTFINGNAAPNVIIGPGVINIDLGVHKEIRLAEGKTLQFRFEGFNAASRTNLTAPAANYFLNTPTGGQITRAKDMRRVQIAAKIVF